MTQISLITCSVEGRQKRSLPNSKMLSLKYRIRREVTFIYSSHKTCSLHNNDSLIFGCILSSQDSDFLMLQMGQKCHFIYTSVSSHVGVVPPPVALLTPKAKWHSFFLLLSLRHIWPLTGRLCNFLQGLIMLNWKKNKKYKNKHTFFNNPIFCHTVWMQM